MKIITKNYGIENGERKYLTYLIDDNGNSLECYDTKGETDRSNVEMHLLKNNNLTTDSIEYISLEEYFRQETKNQTPLILVFYLNEEMFKGDNKMVREYGENVKYYLDSKGDDVRLFFMPTSGDERIECINPVHISDKKELEKLNELTSNLEKLFHVGME